MKKLAHHEIAEHRPGDKEKNASAEGATRAIVIVPVRKFPEPHGPQASASSRLTASERLAEATGLAKAIGLSVCFSGTVPLAHPRPATLLGSGKVEELAAIVKAEDVTVAIVDHALSPIQQRNLEKAWNAKVLDRTGLILEIFADRAQSKEGRLQVELARLTYQKSRLVRSWTHLERQRGGFGFLGGPGETQIEADRRAIGERIDVIRSDLAVVERTRRLHRKRRKLTEQQVVSLVGYTNAGKSTLFNAFSGAGVLAKDMLFATLDPTLRRVEFAEGGAFLLSDTVGFISDLPTQLIAAFRATLEEILEADLILHVRDIAAEFLRSPAHGGRKGSDRDRDRTRGAAQPGHRGVEQSRSLAGGGEGQSFKAGAAGPASRGADILRNRRGHGGLGGVDPQPASDEYADPRCDRR